MSDKKLNLEEHFTNIEEIIEKMESNTSSLDETFELYKKGLDEIKQANQALDKIEKEMLVLNAENELEEF